jgi:hypothetical protein
LKHKGSTSPLLYKQKNFDFPLTQYPLNSQKLFLLVDKLLETLSIAFLIEDIDKKPLLNLMPLKKSSIELGLERILRLAKITCPGWES